MKSRGVAKSGNAGRTSGTLILTGSDNPFVSRESPEGGGR